MTAPSAYRLEQVMSIAQAAAARLQADGVVDEDGAALFAECPDAETMLVRVLRAMDEAKRNREAVEHRMIDLQARADRFSRRHQELRGVAFAMLDALGLTKFKHSEFTASIQAGPKRVLVTDDAAVPAEFFETETVTTLNLTKLKAALTRGDDIPGATLSNSAPSLVVRTK